MKKGFSLIELLISLIIISCIAAALAPVMTKKLQHGKISISQNSKKISSNCVSIHENCKLCYDGDPNCLLCLATCGSGEYVDSVDCACKNCGAKFSNCALCTQTKCTKCASGFGLNSGVCSQCAAGTASDGSGACSACSGYKSYSSAGAASCSTCPTGQKANSAHTGCENITCSSDEYLSGDNCIKCSSTFTNCAKCNASVCTECNSDSRLVLGTCKAMVKPKQASDCAQFNAVFAAINADGTGICITKRNVGDPDGPSSNYSAIKTVLSGTANTITPCPSNTACCWSGAQTTNTANSSYCNEGNIGDVKVAKIYSKFDYRACKRTVCNKAAGIYACAHYKTEKTQEGDWRLPTDAEVSGLASIIRSEPRNDTFNANTSTSKIQKYMGANGLQLCDSYKSSWGSPRCRYLEKNCKGASSANGKVDVCIPPCLISSDKKCQVLESGNLTTNLCSSASNDNDCGTSFSDWNENTVAGSVRCVLDKYPE